MVIQIRGREDSISYAGITPIRYEGIISALAVRSFGAPKHPLACTLQTGTKLITLA